MRIFLILLLIMLMSAAVGCIFSTNDDYDKGAGGVYNITGIFIKPDGNVAAGITVTLSGEIEAEAVTNGNGEYIFEDVPAGSYTVTPVTTVHTHSGVITVTNSDVSFGTNSGGCSGCHGQ